MYTKVGGLQNILERSPRCAPTSTCTTVFFPTTLHNESSCHTVPVGGGGAGLGEAGPRERRVCSNTFLHPPNHDGPEALTSIHLLFSFIVVKGSMSPECHSSHPPRDHHTGPTQPASQLRPPAQSPISPKLWLLKEGHLWAAAQVLLIKLSRPHWHRAIWTNRELGLGRVRRGAEELMACLRRARFPGCAPGRIRLPGHSICWEGTRLRPGLRPRGTREKQFKCKDTFNNNIWWGWRKRGFCCVLLFFFSQGELSPAPQN